MFNMVLFEHSRHQIQCIEISVIMDLQNILFVAIAVEFTGAHCLRNWLLWHLQRYRCVTFQAFVSSTMSVYTFRVQRAFYLLCLCHWITGRTENNLTLCLRLCITVNMWLPWQPVFIKIDADWVNTSETIYNSMTYFLACCMM